MKAKWNCLGLTILSNFMYFWQAKEKLAFKIYYLISRKKTPLTIIVLVQLSQVEFKRI